MAGAPGACGSLVILSSSGTTGWKPTPAIASGAAHIERAIASATVHLTARNRVLVARARRSGLQHNLFFISRPHHLKEIAQPRVVLWIENPGIDAQFPHQMQRSVVVVDLQTVENDVAILCTPTRHTAGAPCRGKFDRHVIRFLEGVFEINGMDPV